jgi:integrase
MGRAGGGTSTRDCLVIDLTAGARDQALLLLGFAVGLRRSELVALTVEDLSPSPDGLRVRIARSKPTSTPSWWLASVWF